MAKAKDQAASSNELVVKAAAAVVVAGGFDYGEQAGAGFDNQTSEDVSVPFLNVLQALSPQCNGANRIKGAVAGMIINSVTGETFDGTEGVIIQPSDTRHVFVEWKPRDQGGGFVKMHDLDSPDVANAKATQEFGSYKTPAGNDLIETYYVTGLLHRSADLAEQAALGVEPVILAFTSTKIKAYKAIMTRLRTVKGRPPMFAHRLKVTTFDDKNNSGEFSNVKIQPLVENDVAKSLIPPTTDAGKALLTAGSELLKANRGGSLKVTQEGQRGTGDGSTAAGDNPPF